MLLDRIKKEIEYMESVSNKIDPDSERAQKAQLFYDLLIDCFNEIELLNQRIDSLKKNRNIVENIENVVVVDGQDEIKEMRNLLEGLGYSKSDYQYIYQKIYNPELVREQSKTLAKNKWPELF
jgi:hypothetical protein